MAALSSDIPYDVDNDLLRPTRALADINRMFDVLSWQTFMALDWPVDPHGTPRASLTDTGAPRWRTFRNARELAPPHGLRPWSWDAGRDERGVAVRNHQVSDPRFRVLPDATQADGNALRDRDGHRVRYESLVDRSVFDHVVRHALYHLPGQRAPTAHPVYLPAGLHWNKFLAGGQVRETDPTRQGSLTLKLAWKVLDARDDPGRFHTQAIPVQDQTGGVRSVTAGLVGMHVAHKTQSCASWVWSTFEHVDALEDSDGLTGRGGGPLFQAARIVPVAEATEVVNREFRSMLREAGSPWCHFRLLGTQRMVRTLRYRESLPVPRHLANPVFETFVPLDRASAISAHQLAALAASPDGETSAASDFMFLLRKATHPWTRIAELPVESIEDWAAQTPTPISGELARALSRQGLNPSNEARLEWLVPSREWLITDGRETSVLRREGESSLAVYRA